MNHQGIRFTPFDKLPQISLVGSEKAIQIGVALASRVAQDYYHEGSKPIVAIFGYPGAGKSTYVKALAWAVKPKAQFNLLEVNCTTLTVQARDPAQAKKWLQDTQRRHMAPHNRPLLVVLDELDEICRSRDDPKYNPVYSWTKDFVRRQYQTQDRTLLVCITNYPGVLDPAVRRQIDNWVYMSVLASESDLTALLTLKGIASDKASEVAEILWRQAIEDSTVHGGAQVVKGTQSALQEHRHLNDRSPQRIADAILARTEMIPREYFDEYEEMHWYLIKRSNLLMEVWVLDDSEH